MCMCIYIYIYIYIHIYIYTYIHNLSREIGRRASLPAEHPEPMEANHGALKAGVYYIYIYIYIRM